MGGAFLKQGETAARERRIWWAPLALAVASACWGVSVPLSKRAVEALPAATLLALQLLVSIVFLWSVLLLRPGSQQATDRPIEPGDLKLACISGILQPGATFLLVTLGLMLTTASEVVLLDAIEPAIITALAVLLLKERLGKLQYLCGILAVIGAILVMLPQVNLAAFSARGLLGDFLVLAGITVAGFYVILSRRLIAAYDGLRLAAIQQSAGLGFAIVALIVASLLQVPPLPLDKMTVDVVVIVILSGLLQFALPFWLYLLALRHTRASITALFLPLIPLSGVATAYLLLGETLDPAQWMGALLIIASVLGSSLLSKTPH
jgi:drug/metabolite transporter (DMT)-like permease